MNAISFINKFYLILSYYYTDRIQPITKFIFGINSFISLGILIYEYLYGYTFDSSLLLSIVNIIIYYFIFYELINLIFLRNEDVSSIKNYYKQRYIEIILAFFVIILIIFDKYFLSYFKKLEYTSEMVILTYLSIAQVIILFNNVLHFSRYVSNIKYRRIKPSLIFLISFLFIIFIGILMLASPKTHNKTISLIDIIFVVVSATCVTGLSPIDIGLDLNLGGQMIILFLIQIGGLGLMTLTSFFSYYLAGQVSLTNQMVMKELFSEISLEKVKKHLKDITLYTFIIETLGAVFLYFAIPDSIIPKDKSKLFYAIFHSISAFCNAGFSLFPDSLYSLSKISQTGVYIIMILIILGGIGFSVISDLFNKFSNKKHKISLTSKIVLISNLIIWSISFLIFLFFRYYYNFNFDSKETLLNSLFFAITPRTAGFNILPYNVYPLPLIFFTFLLMWIGASPVSTGGGIKTTTITIALFHIISLLTGKKNVEIFNRNISSDTIIRSYTNVLLSLMAIFAAIFLLSIFEKHDFLKITFEVVSAYGTVGLSLGITSELTNISKIIISLIMLTGRIGILSLLLAIIPRAKEIKYEYPREYVIVG